MGFAASQARFLSLTSRMLDNEFEAGQIAQQRLALLEQMDLFAEEYSNSTSNKFIEASVFDGKTNTKMNVALTYDVIVGDPQNGGLGLNLVNGANQIVVPNQEEMQRIIENSAEPLTEADFFIFEEVKDPSTLQLNLEQGNFFFAGAKTDDGKWDKKDVEMLDGVTYKYDETDDASAKALYDSRMAKAEKRDTMLEMRLQQLETEHKAIETEMDSVQKVIDDNIEGSFKTFG